MDQIRPSCCAIRLDRGLQRRDRRLKLGRGVQLRVEERRGRLAPDLDRRPQDRRVARGVVEDVGGIDGEIDTLIVGEERQDCVGRELAQARDRIAGGLRTPLDETGDCFKFTNALADLAASRGVAFQWGRTIRAIEVEGGRAAGVRTDAGLVRADAVVVALGSHSPKLVRPHGIALPVYPVKGYSLTIPIRDASLSPESTVMDESYKIAITRLGDRIRVGGMAEISGYTNDRPERRRRTLEHSVTDLFPGGDLGAATFWSGLRPMTPDGTPVIGETRVKGLFLNTGHGTLGWTMSCGSGALLADLVGGGEPEIDARDLGPSRYVRRVVA